MTTRPTDVYLGDGVYASWDGTHVWLDLRAQDSNIRIALDSDVLNNLYAYVKTIEDYIASSQETSIDETHEEDRDAPRVQPAGEGDADGRDDLEAVS